MIRWSVPLLIAIGVLRIVSTYWVFNHTMDEPSFISCGLEWLQQHTYTYMPEQPPLSHVTAGIGAWLAGAHNIPKADLAAKSPMVLYDSPSYYRTLSFARAGELPFFILAAVVVWLWARRLHGDLAGVAAVLLFTTLPPVLAHAGLATTDMALCAMLPAALYAFIRWLDQAGRKQTVLLGLTIAAGVLSKFSFLPFFAVAAVVIVLIRRTWALKIVPLIGALGIATVVISAGNWFSFAPVIQGIQDVREHNYYGHLSYLFGEQRTSGWWYFFPVVLVYKTPIAFLALALMACIWLRRAPREHWIPLACAVAILISVMPSRINIGIRHILPIYPLLAIPAGVAVTRAPRIVAGLLVLWCLVASVRAHPDYIAYFNELARGRPELVRVDSDLDWGQNFDRLARRLRERGIKKVSLGMFGNVNPWRHGFEDFDGASPWQPSTGWVAVSATEKYMSDQKPPDGVQKKPWAWLGAYQPVERIGGGAVFLYYIPAK
jgi:hypothetical protein